MTNTITTVGDLIAALSDHNLAAPVRIAADGAEFMDYTIGRVVVTRGDSDSDCVLPNDAPVVHIGTGDRYCCLPDAAAHSLGWSGSW